MQRHNFIFGCSELAGKVWLSMIIKELNKGKLLANIETHQENPETLRKHLLQGLYDAIFSKLEMDNTNGINEIVLSEHEFKLLVPISHPLVKEKQIDIYQIAATPLIMRHQHFLSNSALRRIFNETGYNPKKKLYLDNIDAMKELVENQMGIGFVMNTGIMPNESNFLGKFTANKSLYMLRY